jgi:uncharacterized SAM-binding protein YcdF (DUF218 family)
VIATARLLVAAAVVAAFIGFGAGVVVETPSVAADAASLTQLKAQAIYYQQKAKTGQRDLTVASMAASSGWENQLWAEFVTSWASINKYMKMNSTVPKGLPTKGHVFVVLGSGLTKSGKLTAKFERRLQLAKKALKAYPSATVLVTGGAPKNGKTEGKVGYAWLVANGIKKSRILVEEKSASTIGNAKNSMAILAKSAEYTSYSLISDSSHLRRASILFDAATLLVQEKSGTPWSIRREANVAYLDMKEAGKVPLSASSVAYAASNVAELLGLLAQYKTLLKTAPAAPVLTSVKVTPPATVTYAVGQGLSTKGLVVTAIYNKGVYSKVVTSKATISGFDSSDLGGGTATASYSDSGTKKSATFAYTIVKAASKVSVSPSTTKATRNKTKVAVSVKVAAAKGDAVPTGKVKFYLDGKLKATVALSGTAAARFTYPKLTTAGKHKLTVKYTGDDSVLAGSASATVTAK